VLATSNANRNAKLIVTATNYDAGSSEFS